LSSLFINRSFNTFRSNSKGISPKVMQKTNK
jgi:hypothetical protein